MPNIGTQLNLELLYAEIESIEEIEFIIVPDMTVWFVLSGYLEIMRNGSTLIIKTGEIILLNKKDIIRVADSKENQTLVFKFSAVNFQDELPAFKMSLPLSNQYKKDSYELIRECLSSLYIEVQGKRQGADYMITSYLNRLVGLLYRHFQNVADQKQQQMVTEKVQHIMSFINRNYKKNLKLDDIADEFFISKFYLSHMFKEQLGITIGNYIKEVRVFHSIQMLEKTDHTITTIALTNGFPNVRSLNDVINQKYKMTPLEFRKNQREIKIKSINKEIEKNDATSLLLSFVSRGEFLDHSLIESEKEKVVIDSSQAIETYRQSNHILKYNPFNINISLMEVSKRLNIKMASVTDIMSKIDVQLKKDRLVCSFHKLDYVLHQIINAEMIPYIQFQSKDYDAWKEKGFREKYLFKEVIKQLHYHIQQNYRNSQSWIYEFRCFYENEQNASLCKPLAECVSLFKEVVTLVVHLPSIPENAKKVLFNDSGGLYCLDDLTFTYKLEWSDLWDSLYDIKQVEYINERKNLITQKSFVDHKRQFETDGYYQHYFDLRQANALVWQHMNQITYNGSILSPVSLDATKLFQYFPNELANNLSLCTKDGRYKENWYAMEFLNSIYEDIIYRSASTLITKQKDNYRILTVYPESEFNQIIQEYFDYPLLNTFASTKQSYISMELTFQNLKGTYRIVKQEMTPELIDKRTDIIEMKNSENLSFDDIAYWNGVNRPIRQVNEVKVQDKYTFNYKVPLFGIVYIELKKISD